MRRMKKVASPRRVGRMRRRNRRIAAAALAVVLAAGLFGAARFGALPSGAALRQGTESELFRATAALGLRVEDIRVTGRTTTSRATILDALDAHAGTPILAVSPSRARARLEALPWVRSVSVERELPDVIRVRLVERRPLALWQHDGKIALIDHQGRVIPVRQLDRFSRLLLVVGPHAAPHAATLIAMLKQQPALAPRVNAAVRVDGRRWNLRLDDRVDVLLPENGAAAAWTELARLERTRDILERDVETIDLRLPDRVVVRLTPQPGKKPSAGEKEHVSASNT